MEQLFHRTDKHLYLEDVTNELEGIIIVSDDNGPIGYVVSCEENWCYYETIDSYEPVIESESFTELVSRIEDYHDNNCKFNLMRFN